jgi:hypothetical protein
MTIPFILVWRLKIWIVMTIFQILQVFHASLCPIGHGGYMDWESGKEIITQFKYRSTILKTLCKRAGVRRFSFHALRHSGASILDNMNVPLGTIQKIIVVDHWP